MGKLQEYTFFQDLQLEMFKNDIRSLINNGKYQQPVIGFLPAWKGNPGESIIYSPASGGMTQYVYNMRTAWVATWSSTA
jgi:hypothetical protein